MARTIYREWFVHFRYPGHENADIRRFALGPIPAGWAVQARRRDLRAMQRASTLTRTRPDRHRQLESLGDVRDGDSVCSSTIAPAVELATAKATDAGVARSIGD